MKPIYLDYNATTPIAPSVVDAMLPFFREHHGNPSSSHSFGRAAAEAIEDARGKLAVVLSCSPDEIIFTSGGSESNNLAIKGVMMQQGQIGKGHIVISEFEHPAVSEPVRYLERLGFDVSVVGCDENGVIELEALETLLRPDTKLVSIMHANNEVGTIQPIANVVSLCHERGILVHTDAAQSFGKIPVSALDLGADLISIAGHKFYGPKGVGALYVKRGTALESFIHGAGHERGLRAVTENTPLIVGLSTAARLAHQCLDESTEKLALYRDKFARQLRSAIPDLVIHGENAKRLPNTLSVSFPKSTGYEILSRAVEVCASTGSACHSSGDSGSATLNAMSVPLEIARGTVRLSLGWNTNEEEIERATSLLVDAWENISVASQQ